MRRLLPWFLDMKKKSFAVIAAAGSGQRMGGISKPNIELLGKSLFEYVMEAFCQSSVDGIAVVCSEDNEESLRRIANGFAKPIIFLRGGKTRAESVRNGIDRCGDAEIICVHDCARPFITKEMIEESISAAEEFGAACVCSPITDTVKYKEPETGIVSTPARENMFAVQTPQCFKKEHYLRAEEAFREEISLFTDETSLLEAIGIEVKYIKTLNTNMKLTAIDDVPIAEILMKQRVKTND